MKISVVGLERGVTLGVKTVYGRLPATRDAIVIVNFTLNLIMTLAFGNGSGKIKLTQLLAVDHSARRSMKNAASCVTRCELQDTPSTRFSNAYCGFE